MLTGKRPQLAQSLTKSGSQSHWRLWHLQLHPHVLTQLIPEVLQITADVGERALPCEFTHDLGRGVDPKVQEQDLGSELGLLLPGGSTGKTV